MSGGAVGSQRDGGSLVRKVEYHVRQPRLAARQLVWVLAQYLNGRWAANGISSECVVASGDRCVGAWEPPMRADFGFVATLDSLDGKGCRGTATAMLQQRLRTIVGACALHYLLQSPPPPSRWRANQYSLSDAVTVVATPEQLLPKPPTFEAGRCVPRGRPSGWHDFLRLHTKDRYLAHCVLRWVRDALGGKADRTVAEVQDGSLPLYDAIVTDLYTALRLFAPTAHPGEHKSLRGFLSKLVGCDWSQGAFGPSTAPSDRVAYMSDPDRRRRSLQYLWHGRQQWQLVQRVPSTVLGAAASMDRIDYAAFHNAGAGTTGR